ncbi:MAG: ATP-dependent helicase [Actinomycetota bacterium]|nr:ATP-dependent helicase [Actinomycetota bacterium]
MCDSGWADGLDDAQLEAVEHGSGPLVVVAGAGTGKTRMLTSRVARLLESGVKPERILLLTFTRRAAASLVSRSAALAGDPRAGARLWGGTFHAVAHRIISEHVASLGLSAVTVLDPPDVVDLIDLLREEHGLTGTKTRLPSSQRLADVYSRVVNTARPARQVIDDEIGWCAEEQVEQILSLFRAFSARKRERGLLDFDDLLLCWGQLLADPTVGERLRRRWHWVLVDEYQDVNQAQVAIITGLCPQGSGLTVVGDDAQAIYGFRGASGAHLDSLLARFTTATLVRLQRNFRSVQPILDLANVVRPEATVTRPGADVTRPAQGETRLLLTADREGHADRPVLIRCEDPDAEARLVADAVLGAQQDGVSLRQQAVLMRAGSHSGVLEIELSVRKVPYVKYGGLSFLETAHVRDLMAALRVTVNRRDELAWYRVVVLHRGIGKASARVLLPHLVTDTVDLNAVVAAAPHNSRTSLTATLTQLIAAGGASPAERAAACVTAVLPLIRARYVDWHARVEDVTRLGAIAATRADLAAFVAEVALDPSSSTSDYAKPPHLDDDFLTLSTIHSAKGLEWQSVHLLRVVDGALPSDMALSDDDGLLEEQRLFYVAATRARDRLTMYTPLRLPTDPTSFRARHVYAKASRFLTEQACALLDVQDRPAAPAATRCEDIAGARVVIPTLDHLFS